MKNYFTAESHGNRGRVHEENTISEIRSLYGKEAWEETWRRVWGGRKIFSPTKMTNFSEKISILAANISDDYFLFSHRPGFSNFSSLLPDFPDLCSAKSRT